MPKAKGKAKAGKKKIKTKSSPRETTEADTESVPTSPPDPKFLSETEAIYFWSAVREDKSDLLVPPCTPQNISSFVTFTQPLPTTFPSFDNFEIPFVREVGVKKSMEIMAKYLKCGDYAFDYLQFWIIDILVDCLWKSQDEYYLGESEQKIVLEWVVYVFKIMTDPKLCFSRKQFFKFFQEIILTAADVLNEGYPRIPKPEELFVLTANDEETEQPRKGDLDSDEECLESHSSTESSSTHSIAAEILEAELEQLGRRTYNIKRKKCCLYLDEDSAKFDLPTSLSSTPPLSGVLTDFEQKEEVKSIENGKEVEECTEEIEQFPNKYYKIFHQPDPNMPKRFLPVPTAAISERNSVFDDNFLNRVVSDDGGEYRALDLDVDANYINSVVEKLETATEPKIVEKSIEKCDDKIAEEQARKSNLSTKNSKALNRQSKEISSDNLQKSSSKKSFNKKSRELSFSILPTPKPSAMELNEEEIMKRLREYKLWEKRMEDMADPRIGWLEPAEENVPVQPDFIDVDNEDWEDLVEAKDIKRIDERLYVGLGVLCAIADFVFEYFYRNFHYTLITLATKTFPSVITQRLNQEWKVPKAIKDDFHRPKPEKKKKEKKEKKAKSSKGSKKSSKKGKKDKKSSKKGSKKSRDQKSKKSKDSKKGKKKDKPKKLTKEEKAELDRQRRMQEEYEEEQRRLEENKRLLFPLTDAATDDFFMDIFEGWQKPKEQDKKGKKGKKDKKDKKGGKKGKKK